MDGVDGRISWVADPEPSFLAGVPESNFLGSNPPAPEIKTYFWFDLFIHLDDIYDKTKKKWSGSS